IIRLDAERRRHEIAAARFYESGQGPAYDARARVMEDERRDEIDAPLLLEDLEAGQHLALAWAAEGGDQRLEGRPVERRKTWSAGRLEGAEATTEDVEVRGARAQREDRGERAGQRDTPRQRAALGRGHPEGEQDEERRQRLSDSMSHHV